MSDGNDELNLDDAGGTESVADSPRKAGGLLGGIMPILKWVGIGLAAIGAVVLIVVFTVNAMGAGGKGNTLPQNVTDESLSYNPIPEKYFFYDTEISPLQSQTRDNMSITLRIKLAYKEDDKNFTTDLLPYIPQIKEDLMQKIAQYDSVELDLTHYKAHMPEFVLLINNYLGGPRVKDIVMQAPPQIKPME